MKSLFRIQNGALLPDDERSKRWLGRQKHPYVLIEHKGVRSPDQLRLYWKLLDTAWDTLPEGAQEQYGDTDGFSAAIKCALGFCTERRIVKRDGTTEIIRVPKSLALGNMEPETFNAFFDGAQKLIAETLGVTVDDLARESEGERYMRAG